MEEIVALHITTPSCIAKLVEAQKRGATVFQTLDILPIAQCGHHSIEFSWRPPTKNAERISGYVVSMVNPSGVVKPVYHGTETSCEVTGLGTGVDYVFSVRANYSDGSYVRSAPQSFGTRVVIADN